MKAFPEKIVEACRVVQMLMDVYGKLVKCDECLPVAANEVDFPLCTEATALHCECCMLLIACLLLGCTYADRPHQPLMPYLACLSCKWWLGQAGSLTTSLSARRYLNG